MFRSKSITLQSIISILSAAIFINISTPALLMAMDKDGAIELGDLGGKGGGKGLVDPGVGDPGVGVVDDAVADAAGALISPWWLVGPGITTCMFLATTIVFIILWLKDPHCDPSNNSTCYEMVKNITECVLEPLCYVDQAQLGLK